METVGVRALKAQLSRYIGKAKAGETIIVTEHGQEVAELIPISKERRVVQHFSFPRSCVGTHTSLTILYKSPTSLLSHRNFWHWNIANVLPHPHTLV